MVTAGHCVCTLRKRVPDSEPHPHEKALCIPSNENIFFESYKNQIRPGYNEIYVYGGEMDKTKYTITPSMEIHNQFKIEKAYAKNRLDNLRWDGKHDVGVLVTNKLLFDKEKLKKNINPFDKPPILPICLAGKTSELVDEKIQGVGWGLKYDASPDPKDPHISSCMTNEVGPPKWRFHNCNMQEIKKNNWSCEKQELPRSIPSEDRKRCKAFFSEARQKVEASKIEFMDNVDKIIIKSANKPNEILLTCYNKAQFTDNGWCIVHNKDPNVDQDAWGFCSPSCNTNLMKVLIFSRHLIVNEIFISSDGIIMMILMKF